MRRLVLLAVVSAALVVPASAASASESACYEIKIPTRPTLYICV